MRARTRSRMPSVLSLFSIVAIVEHYRTQSVPTPSHGLRRKSCAHGALPTRRRAQGPADSVQGKANTDANIYCAVMMVLATGARVEPSQPDSGGRRPRALVAALRPYQERSAALCACR